MYFSTVLAQDHFYSDTSAYTPVNRRPTEDQSSIDDVDCSCQKRNLLYKLDESFCARHSEMDDYNLIYTHASTHSDGVGYTTYTSIRKLTSCPCN
jgi:hypothetical protein